jgi:hypothetical protein
MAADTVSLEHFTTLLRNSRILCYGTFTAYPPIMEYIKDIRNPIKKMVLITNNVFGLNSHYPFHYDAVFQARDSNDWTMIVTHLTYVVKPALVVCDVLIPDALWKKIGKDVTFIHLLNPATQSIVSQNAVRAYDCIFFAEDTDSHRILQNIYKSTYTTAENKEIVQELRVAGAGLVWTRVSEPSGGNIYWYDPVQYQQVTLSKGQMGELFSWLALQYRE